MSLHDWIAERPEPERPDADPEPYAHNCWSPNGIAFGCRACDADQAEAEGAA